MAAARALVEGGPPAALDDDEEDFHACEQHRYPLMWAACRRKWLVHSLAAGGKLERFKRDGRGRRSISIFLLSQTDVADVPILEHLPTALAVFAFDYMRIQLGLPLPGGGGDPSPAELNHVLHDCLVADSRMHHLQTFGLLDLRSRGCQGIQRLRSYPFSDDSFNKRNWYQTVGVVPSFRYSRIRTQDFDPSKPEHLAQMWVGRLWLLFTCKFRSSQPAGQRA